MLDKLTNDQQRLLFTILISFPLAIVLTYIKSPNLRKTFNIVVGLTLQIYMYKEAYLNVVFACIVIFILSKTLSRKVVGYYCLIYSFLHLSILHLYRQIYDYGSWRMDITTIFMVLALKLTAFGFSYQDGYTYELLKKENNQEWIKLCSTEKFVKYTKPYIIEDFSFIEYLGYIVFFPTALMGPFVEFKTFIDFISLNTEDYKAIPSTYLPSLKRLGLGLVFTVVFLRFKDVFTVNYFLNEEGIVSVLAYCLLLCQKFKYYIAFLFSEGICIASGISYHRKYISSNDKISNASNLDNKSNNKEFNLSDSSSNSNSSSQLLEYEEKWDKVINIRVYPCETKYSVKSFFQNWNISVHTFLKRYIYFRVINTNKNEQNAVTAQCITFLFSAIWHGFYPSYYFLFAHFAIGLVVELQFDKMKQYYQSKLLSKILDGIFQLGFFIIGNYCVGVIEALDYPLMIRFMKEVYYLPTILVCLAFIINALIISTFKRKHCSKEESVINKQN